MSPDTLNRHPSHERGIALVAAILVVMLSSILVATFLMTTTGERAMSSNVQVAKEALYAADAGVRAEQQDLANKLNAKIDSCANAYTGSGLVIVNPSNLFPSGAYSINCVNPPFAATGNVSFMYDSISSSQQVYDYQFTIQSTGTTASGGTRSVQAQGVLRVSAQRGNFSDFLVFTNTHSMADGSQIWFSSNTTFDGQVKTNTKFRFAFQPTFHDLVASHDPNADYLNNGNVLTLNASNNAPVDVPNFYGGFLRNQATVPMPTNSYDQQAFALRDTNNTSGVALTTSQINSYLGHSGSSTPADSIYFPHTGTAMTGGIYVQGSLDQCKAWADTVNNRQWYQLTQGTKVRTVLVDRGANTTKIWNSSNTSGAATWTYTGIPGNATQGAVMYVTGSITDLRGPDRTTSNPPVVPAAIAENNKLLIAAGGDITITRDVTLDRYNNNDNVLGVMSFGGSVHVGTSAPNDCNLDAFVMATGASGEFTVDSYNTGSPRGIFHLRGGMVASFYGAFGTFNSTTGQYLSGYGRNFMYDRRGLWPPCYPVTNRFDCSNPSARTLAWKEI